MSEEIPDSERAGPARPVEAREQFLRQGWDELLRHSSLKEFMRVEGSDLAGQPFWLILQPGEAHWIHLLAYSYLGVVGRAQPGSAGIISVKPGDWGDFQTARRADGIVRFSCGSSATEPVWQSGSELRIAIGNIVNYVSGNALVFKSVARQLQFRHIKGWDLPVEFALSAGSAGTADRAAGAIGSGSAEFAAGAMLAESANASDRASQAGLGAASIREVTEGDSIQRLPNGKVHLLTQGENSALEVMVDGPISLRVFVPGPSSEGRAPEAQLLAQIARMECLMHMRLRPLEKPAGESPPGLLVVYFDAASNSIRMENLCERNIVGVARFGDGRWVDVVKLSQRLEANANDGWRMVRIVNLAHEMKVVLAVWKSDPILPTLQEGRRVGKGRYTLARTLGAGGMGVVWLAFDEQLREPVALKFLSQEIRADSASLEDLRRETLKNRKLSHPNIVRIHDMHQFEGEAPFISMEFVDGPTLMAMRSRQRQRVLSWEQLEPLVMQLCEALDYAHRESVIHRDLKPSNLMTDSTGRLKLADFGIAGVMSESGNRTTAAPASGTPPYMSPQQLQGEPAQVTDDIYALGATLYELLTSKPPFYTGDVAGQTLSAAPAEMAERLAELGLTNEIPPAVSAMVMSCLAKDPAGRPQSARAVAEAAGGELANAGNAALPPAPKTADLRLKVWRQDKVRRRI